LLLGSDATESVAALLFEASETGTVGREFVGQGGGAELLQAARQVVARTLEASTAEERSDWGVIKEKIRADLKRYLKKHTARHPLIVPVILEI
jgi:ribonuclease J